MKVRVNVNGLDIAVSVGGGEQSLTWLAMVASQQYELLKPKGRSRVREPSFSKRGFFLPESIMSSKEEILDPKTKICDVFSDDASVFIKLQDTVEVNDIGAPVLSEWQQSAFCVGEASRTRLKAEKERKDHLKHHKMEEQQRLKDIDIRKKFETNISIENTQPYEIKGLNHEWATIAEVLVGTSQKDVNELLEFFPTVFPTLSEIYQFYVGENFKTQNSSMTFAEWSHFLHSSRAYHAYKDTTVIKKLFSTAIKASSSGESKIDDDDNSSSEDDTEITEKTLQQGEFMAAVVLASQAKSEDTMRPTASLKSFVEEFLEANWDNRRDDKMKAIVENESVNHLVSATFFDIRKIFHHYVGGEFEVMNCECFQKLCKDAGLLMKNPGESEDAAEERMSKVGTNSFFSAQGDPPRHLELEEIVFGEFLDATCRLSCDTLNPNASSFQRVQLGLDALLDLATRSLR
ncbi:hypothetical protein ScalyP_jg9700 [Parmales sp. scaly parma]|nr:hypothetical protein ScalyP_jg9700 [Parmales sp. scaly parma]